MCRAVNHAFLDQSIANWCNTLDLDAKAFGDFAGTLHRLAHIGESAQILFLSWSQAIESDTEEVCIQPTYRLIGGPMDHIDADG